MYSVREFLQSTFKYMQQRTRCYIYKLLLLLCLIPLVVMQTGASINTEANKYQIISVYMYNFFRYVRWPVGLETDAAPPLTLCTIGNDPFETGFHLIKDKRPYGKPIVIKRHVALQDAEECSILYISKSEEKKLDYILSTLKKYPILTVSEINDFVYRGGMVQFLMAKGALSFNINNSNIRKSGLEARVVLLEVSNYVIK